MFLTFSKKVKGIVVQIDQGNIVTEGELERHFLNAVEEELRTKGLTPVIEQQRKIIRGRTDARIGGLVFEFKKPLRRPLQDLLDRLKQVQDYIDEYRTKNVLLRGILTDGGYIVFVDEYGQVVEQGKIEDCTWMLEVWISALALRVASPVDLKNYLGPASSVGKALIKQLFESYENHKSGPFIKECYEMWDGVYGCATNLDEDAIEAVKTFARNSLDVRLETKSDVKSFLFVVETYLSVLMKLLVAEVAIQKSVIPATTLEELLGEDVLTGYEKLSDRISFLSRVFEYDTFYWFVDLTKRNTHLNKIVSGFVAEIVKILGLMDFTAVSTDLVKQMYQGFFDSATRKALGEFYTPDVLVDQVLDAVNYQGKPILEACILDPACGSGTFLVRAIDRFIKVGEQENLPRSEALRKIADQIIGVDIHPFAVAMAKVNYLLALARLVDPTVRRTLKTLPIPIYWADSLARATINSQFGPTLVTVRTVEIRVPVLGTFTLPDPNEIDWDRLIDSVLTAVDNDWSDERFLGNFSQDKRLAYKDVLLNFLKVFREREAKDSDGRWLSTLRNFIVIDKLRERCDFIVGNPPWVRIHNINDDIRNELVGKFEVYKKDKKSGKVVGWNPKLRATRVPFPQQIDYCMAFVEAGLSYLRGKGKLGFVITAKIMNALYANLLRRLIIEKTNLVKLTDYSLSDKQFFEEATNYPLVLALEKGLSSEDVNIDVVAASQFNWNTDQKYLPILANDNEAPWCIAPVNVADIFRKMQRNNPRLGDLLGVQRGVMTSANDIFLVTDFAETATPNVVTIVNEGGEKGNIEIDLLRRFIRGEDISTWKYQAASYILWTHDDETGDVKPTLPNNAEQYFAGYERALLKRDDYKKGQPIWTIFRVSKEKLGKKVAWGELARCLETVVLPESIGDERLGEKKLVPIQTVYFIAVKSLNQGYLFSALFNSTPVRSFIISFAERARGRYFRHISWTVGLVPVPTTVIEGKMKDPVITEIIKLSKKLHENKGEDRELADQLDKAVARLYGLSEGELDELRKYLVACGVPTLEPTSIGKNE